MERLVVLASGKGTDFQSILDHINLGVLQGVKPVLLICNNADAFALTRARKAGVKTKYIEGIVGKNFSDLDSRRDARRKFDSAVIEELKKHNTTVIALAGFNQIVSPVLIDSYSMRVLNIHPAFDTERYGGVGMYGDNVHRAVLANHELYSGCTVHYVDNSVDLGPVILRQRVHIKKDDTIESLSNRILVWEHRSYSKALQIHVDNLLNKNNLSQKDEWEKKWNERQQKYINYQTEHSVEIYGKNLNEII